MGQVRIKICGITTAEDAEQAARLGADAIGLNFYERSPRYVSPSEAGGILRTLPPFVEPVGLFVEQPLQQVFQFLRQMVSIRTVQWHGEQPEICDAFPFRLIPAFRVRDRQSLPAIRRHLYGCQSHGWLPAAILVDAYVTGQYGGTGHTIPWDALTDLQLAVPLILAGGLTPDNVAEAIRIVRPFGVDVASGVEASPGRKDVDKMRRFIDIVRSTV
jgi:phosphoribosylanthranilate isomerase